LLAVHEVLDQLAAEDEEAANLVKLRYFAGMTMTEAAAALGSAVAHGRADLDLRPDLAAHQIES
jgi:hypothetical protein